MVGVAATDSMGKSTPGFLTCAAVDGCVVITGVVQGMAGSHGSHGSQGSQGSSEGSQGTGVHGTGSQGPPPPEPAALVPVLVRIRQFPNVLLP